MPIPIVRSISLKKYSQVAQGLGMDPLRMLSKMDLDQVCLSTGDLRIPEASFADLLEASAHESSHAPLGLLMGAEWRLSDFGCISLALQHQASLASALQTMKDYQHLLSSTIVLDTVQQGRLAFIQLNLATERDVPGRHPIELGIAVLLSLCRHQLGQAWSPSSVHFTHSAPPNLRRHQALFGCDVVFDSDFDGIVLAQDDLHGTQPHYDAAMEQHARFLLNSLAPESAAVSVEQQVHRAIQALLPHGHHNIAQVAKMLGQTTRSLQRQLEVAGTNYQLTLNTVRMRAAVRALRNANLPIGDVATLSGFSEISSFSRWFAKQFEQSPSHWRDQNLATPAATETS
ncbi:AraC family transcriptional regulator [Comamonas humi]